MSINAYPLHWPHGWPRTKRFDKSSSKFKSTFAVARDELLIEIGRLRGRYCRGPAPILSTNVSLRQDGLPYANQRAPEDCGVAIYFERKGKQLVFACDKYHTVWENMVAIRKTIEAIRGMERWGASDMMERAFQGFVALPGNDDVWWVVLGVPEHAPPSVIEPAYRTLRASAHPDKGGSADQFNRVQKAYQQWCDSRSGTR